MFTAEKKMRTLNESGIKLTDLEKRTLNCIVSQGSYYEENLLSNTSMMTSVFIGYEIDEYEVKGCRGALSSLVKKGVLNIVNSEDGQMYFINYLLTFLSKGYHNIDFTGNN